MTRGTELNDWNGRETRCSEFVAAGSLGGGVKEPSLTASDRRVRAIKDVVNMPLLSLCRFNLGET